LIKELYMPSVEVNLAKARFEQNCVELSVDEYFIILPDAFFFKKSLYKKHLSEFKAPTPKKSLINCATQATQYDPPVE